MHKPVESQGYKITLNKRRSPISILNEDTFQYLSHEVTEENTTIISAVITRFNKLTGTGRLIHGADDKSISFAPARSWKIFPRNQRKVFSRNLDRNNGTEDFQPIELEVTRVLDRNNLAKHYKVHRVILD